MLVTLSDLQAAAQVRRRAETSLRKQEQDIFYA